MGLDSSASSTEVDNLADNINQLKISAPSLRDKDTVVLECARACAVLTKVTACLDVNSGPHLSSCFYNV
jgi:separase